MSSDEAMERIDTLLSHVWMVRTFVKHSEDTRAVSSTVFLSTVTAVISLPLWMLLAAG